MAGQAHLHSLSAQARAVKGILFLGTTLAFARDDSSARFNLKSTTPPHPPSGTTITSEAQAGPSLPTAVSLFSANFRSVSALIMIAYLGSPLVR